MSNGLEHAIGPMGWGVENETIDTKRVVEARYLQQAIAANPTCYQQRDPKDFIPEIKAKFDALQQQCGRLGANSCDMTLLDYFVFGQRFDWFPQDIGSCVWSNTFRMFVLRMIAEICLRGDPEEYFGRDEHGQKSIAPHCVSYGLARQRANMRGGDGLYCRPMVDSLTQDGVVMCSTPKLIEVMGRAGANKPEDLPEPRSASLYRQIGNWQFNDELRPFCDHKVLESVPLESVDTHLANSLAFKPAFQCSSIAIRKVGTHKDGFPIHARDPGNSWPHNMGWAGHFYSSDGMLFFRLSNLSWQQNSGRQTALPRWDDAHEKYIYNIPAEELDGWYRRKLVDTATIGEIDLPDSAPATL